MSKNYIVDFLLESKLELKLSQNTDEEQRLIVIVCDLHDELSALLTPEQKILFDRYIEAKADYHSEALKNHFSEGF